LFKFFPVFSYAIQQLTTESIRIGVLRDPTEADLNSDGFLLGVYRISESQKIIDQGFKTQYRLKIDFNYEILIASRNGEDQCNEYSSLFLEKLPPGIDVHITDFDGNNYNMYLNEVKDSIEFKSDLNLWFEKLNFAGYTYIKYI
jgi:hypothetical protein